MSRMLTKGLLDQRRYEAEERERKERQRLAREAEQRERRADIVAAYKLQQQIEAARRAASEPKSPMVRGTPAVREARSTPFNELGPPPLGGKGIPPYEPTWEDPLFNPEAPPEPNRVPESPPSIPPSGPFGPGLFGPERFDPKEFDPEKRDQQPDDPLRLKPEDFYMPPIDPKNPPQFQPPTTPQQIEPKPIEPAPFDPNEPIGGIPGSRMTRASMPGAREGESELRRLLWNLLMEYKLRRSRDG